MKVLPMCVLCFWVVLGLIALIMGIAHRIKNNGSDGDNVVSGTNNEGIEYPMGDHGSTMVNRDHPRDITNQKQHPTFSPVNFPETMFGGGYAHPTFAPVNFHIDFDTENESVQGGGGVKGDGEAGPPTFAPVNFPLGFPNVNDVPTEPKVPSPPSSPRADAPSPSSPTLPSPPTADAPTGFPSEPIVPLPPTSGDMHSPSEDPLEELTIVMCFSFSNSLSFDFLLAAKDVLPEPGSDDSINDFRTEQAPDEISTETIPKAPRHVPPSPTSQPTTSPVVVKSTSAPVVTPGVGAVSFTTPEHTKSPTVSKVEAEPTMTPTEHPTHFRFSASLSFDPEADISFSYATADAASRYLIGAIDDSPKDASHRRSTESVPHAEMATQTNRALQEKETENGSSNKQQRNGLRRIRVPTAVTLLM